jgi:hypothetical protein
MLIIFIFYLLMNVLEVLIPYLRMGKAIGQEIDEEWCKGKSQVTIMKRKVFIEKRKAAYDDGEINGVVEEYFEITMQAGFVFLFSIAFGLIPLLCVLNNVFETFIDRAKLLYLTRRPVQQSVKSHGMFTYLIECLAFIGIFTNFAIMCFTAEAFGKDDRFVSFIWISIGIFVLRFVLQEMIPDEPEVVFNVRQRHNKIVEQTLGKQDRTEEDMAKGEKTFFRVQNTYDDDGNEIVVKDMLAEEENQ